MKSPNLPLLLILALSSCACAQTGVTPPMDRAASISAGLPAAVSWSIAEVANEYTVVIDPAGHMFSGPARPNANPADGFVHYKLPLNRPAATAARRSPRTFQLAAGRADPEFFAILDNEGNLYAGSVRTPDVRFILSLAYDEANPPKYSMSLSGANGEFIAIVDSNGNIYTGSIRTPDVTLRATLHAP